MATRWEKMNLEAGTESESQASSISYVEIESPKPKRLKNHPRNQWERGNRTRALWKAAGERDPRGDYRESGPSYDRELLKEYLSETDEKDPGCISAIRPSNFSTPASYIRSGGGSTRETCGKIRFSVACENWVKDRNKPMGDRRAHDKPVRVFHQCGRLACPVCYQYTSEKIAMRIEERLDGLKGAYQKAGIPLGRLKHIAFSPPQKWLSQSIIINNQSSELRRELIKIIKKYSRNGFYGGVLVFHMQRQKHMDGSECSDKSCSLEHVWVYGPHFHFIGYGFFEQSNIVHEATGWVYKRLAEKEGRDRSIFATVSYQMSHSTIFINGLGEQIGTGYWYIGCMSNAKGGFKERERYWTPKLCSRCRGELHEYETWLEKDKAGRYRTRVDWMDGGNLGPHYDLVIAGDWYLNLPKKAKETPTPSDGEGEGVRGDREI